ncbi:hypothetical protein F5Y17DRAFT_438076 [Xylariaceae sp. FL0594]|nr:hypothetical protein F5Y17DRAFT_438076 [Xylariaceae sp. FL0594]
MRQTADLGTNIRDKSTFSTRRRTPNNQIRVPDDIKPRYNRRRSVEAGDVAPDHELSDSGPSDSEFSADEASDSEEELDSHSPTKTTFPSASLTSVETTIPATITLPQLTTPATTLATTTQATLSSIQETWMATSQLTIPSPPATTLETRTTTTLSPVQESSQPTPTPALTSATSDMISAVPVVSVSDSVPALGSGAPAVTTLATEQSSSRRTLTTASPSEVPKSNNAETRPPIGEGQDVSHDHPFNTAGTIAGATIGTLAAVCLIMLLIWIWRRRRNRLPANLPGMSEPLGQHNSPNTIQWHTSAPAPVTKRSPSSIMNRLMTAVYAAEDGNHRDSDEYYNTSHANESTQRLTTLPMQPPQHPPSVAARTEETTWNSWGGGNSQSLPPPQQRQRPVNNWWVERYFKSQPMGGGEC